jgi:hypothetical protein
MSSPPYSLPQAELPHGFCCSLFDSLDHIIDVCCDAWNRILAEPGRIRSTCGDRWASQVKI